MFILKSFQSKKPIKTIPVLPFQISIYPFLFLLFINFINLSGCYPSLKEEAQNPEQALQPVKFFYPAFHDDMDYGSLAHAIIRNFEYLDRLNPDHLFHYGPHTFTNRQVRESQEAFLELIQKTPDPKELNRLVKKEFKLYRAAGRTGNRHTLFTGYFEPIYQASLTRNKTFKYPIYRKPDSLITIELSDFNRKYGGDKIVARIEGDKVLPYYTRKQIEFKNILRNKGLEIAWLRDTVDVAFLHIQGSGRLTLPGGKMLSVGYHASNGRPYQSIGKYMLDKGYLDREEMSMQSIRKYLRTHPGVINRVLNYNPSYVFFRKRENGPFGNINVPLTPGRSMALNSRLFPKGALCFISTDKPVVDKDGKITEWVGFSRFVMNQDTGGAITGAGRADIFWGSGQYAEIAAGHLKHEGELYILIKKSFK